MDKDIGYNKKNDVSEPPPQPTQNANSAKAALKGTSPQTTFFGDE